ncbi:MAG: hypothetical protein AAGE52_30240 [Myxococcota bacterium]
MRKTLLLVVLLGCTSSHEPDGTRVDAGFWLLTTNAEAGETALALLRFDEDRVAFDRGAWGYFARSGSLQLYQDETRRASSLCGLWEPGAWSADNGRLWIEFGCDREWSRSAPEPTEVAFGVRAHGEGRLAVTLERVGREEGWLPRFGPWFLTRCASDACWPLGDEDTVFGSTSSAGPERR